MSREKTWLKKIDSYDYSDKVAAMQMLTSKVAVKYKDKVCEIVKKDPDLFLQLSIEIRKALPDVCLAVVEKNPQTICYVPEEIVEQNPEILNNVTNSEWVCLIRDSRYTNMPLEIADEHLKLIGKFFKLRSDGTTKFSEEICDKHPEIVEEALRKTIKRNRNTEILKASLPPKILEPYAEEIKDIEELEKLIAENKLLCEKKESAKCLDCDVEKEIKVVSKRINDKYQGEQDHGAR